MRLRQGLVIVQFALAVFLAGGAVVVWQQVDYLRGQDAGFQEEHVVVVPLHGRALGAAEAADARLETFRQALLADAPFAAASLTDVVPGRYQFNFNTFYPDSGPTAEGGSGSPPWTATTSRRSVHRSSPGCPSLRSARSQPTAS